MILVNNNQISFSIQFLEHSVLESTEVTQTLPEKELRAKDIKLHVTCVIHADMKLEAEIHRKHYGVHQTVREAQAEYSRAIDAIPTGFKALCLDLGRAYVSIVKSIPSLLRSIRSGVSMSIGNQTSKNNRIQSFAINQIPNFASCFGQSLGSINPTNIFK